MSLRHLHGLLRPQAVVTLGKPVDALAEQVLSGLNQSSALLRFDDLEALTALPAGKRLLALVADPEAVNVEVIQQLGGYGCQALLWPAAAPAPLTVLQETRRQGIRLLGPRAGGVLRPAGGYRAATFPGTVRDGGLALIAQSQSVAAAALDWAAGRRLGFSWIAISGAEADIDVADLLDYAALDPQTRSVAVQLSSLRGGRKFMSAARACARVKPVVVLQTQPAARIGGGADPVRSAAFARAGLVECESLPGLFDALAALHRLPALERPEVAMIGNGAGICALGVDLDVRDGAHGKQRHVHRGDPVVTPPGD
jgi:acyl-CoA synthetase (NDP forming)